MKIGKDRKPTFVLNHLESQLFNLYHGAPASSTLFLDSLLSPVAYLPYFIRWRKVFSRQVKLWVPTF